MHFHLTITSLTIPVALVSAGGDLVALSAVADAVLAAGLGVGDDLGVFLAVVRIAASRSLKLHWGVDGDVVVPAAKALSTTASRLTGARINGNSLALRCCTLLWQLGLHSAG